MRAILRTGFGRPDVLATREVPAPEPKDGHAVIQVKAFGLNHAELHMRKAEWAVSMTLNSDKPSRPSVAEIDNSPDPGR